MLKYPSTKHILIAAIVSSALTACGNSGSNQNKTTQAPSKPPEVVVTPEPELKLLKVPFEDSAKDLNYASQVGVSTFRATLLADLSGNALKQTVATLAETPISDSASGVLIVQMDANCNPSGKYSLTATENEGPTPTELHNQLDTHFAADFSNCSMKSGGAETLIDGKLDINLSLNIAKIIGAASFGIETRVDLSNFMVSTNNKSTFFADGSAIYSFGTADGYKFTTKLETDDLKLNAGTSMILVDFTSEHTTDTRDSTYEITANGKYTDRATGFYVNVVVDRPFTGLGYNYPAGGKMTLTTDGATIILDVQKSDDIETYPPDGSYLRVRVTSGANSATSRFAWKDVDLAKLSFDASAAEQ